MLLICQRPDIASVDTYVWVKVLVKRVSPFWEELVQPSTGRLAYNRFASAFVNLFHVKFLR